MSTPPPASSKPSAGGIAIGIAIGLAIMMVVGLVGGIAGYAYIRKAEADARRGWNLVPVVVAGEDMPEGTVVTFDKIVQRQVPEQFVTSSVVKPDVVSYVVNQKLLVPVQAGDPLLWSAFEVARSSKPSPRPTPVGSAGTP